MNEFESHPPAAAESGAGDVTGTEGAAAHGAADTAAADEATHAQSATHVLPEGVLPVVAVRDTVLFPGTVFPLAIGRAASIRAVQHAMRLESPIGVLLQRNAETIDPAGGDLHEVGTIANILRYVNAPDGEHHIVVQGLQRFRVREIDVYVRELCPGRVEEPLKEEAVPDGVDRRNPAEVADKASSSAASSRAHTDALGLGPSYDITDNHEIVQHPLLSEDLDLRLEPLPVGGIALLPDAMHPLLAPASHDRLRLHE